CALLYRSLLSPSVYRSLLLVFCSPLYPPSTFFSYCSSPHLDLHSFPTRRSSDLLIRRSCCANCKFFFDEARLLETEIKASTRYVANSLSICIRSPAAYKST